MDTGDNVKSAEQRRALLYIQGNLWVKKLDLLAERGRSCIDFSEICVSVLVCCDSHRRSKKAEVDRVVNNHKAHYSIKIDPVVFKR